MANNKSPNANVFWSGCVEIPEKTDIGFFCGPKTINWHLCAIILCQLSSHKKIILFQYCIML